MFAQDPKLKQKWIDAAGIPDWKPSKSAVLCEVSTETCIQMFYNFHKHQQKYQCYNFSLNINILNSI